MCANSARLGLVWLWLSIINVSAAEFSGQLSMELRGFSQDAQYPRQLNGLQTSIMLAPEWRTYLGDNIQTALIPYLRVDARDHQRTHADLREAYMLYIGNNWELLLGVNREFWGVTEARHLINIINQVDAVENIDEEDYLGQLMLNLTLQRAYGRFSFYLLPLFRERTFSSEKGRLRAPLSVDENRADYEHQDQQWHTDLAFRYSHYRGDWDMGVSVFHGTSREPHLRINHQQDALLPYYDQISQLGLELQYTQEAMLWKFEGLTRAGQGHTFLASVVGLEYTLFQAFNSQADIGFLVEHLYDGRDRVEAPQTIFQNDLFLGIRVALNDMQDTTMLAGMMRDLQNESGSLRLEAERRVGDSIKLELETQLFINAQHDRTVTAFKRDNFVTLTLAQYF